MRIIDRIKDEVSIYDLFDEANPPIRYMTRGKQSQISCPFHGEDAHPSARVYPDSNSFRCYTCSQSWDVVSYWAQANEWYKSEDKLDIKRAIDDLCEKYGLSNTFSDWEKRFYALKKQHEDDQTKGVTIDDRIKLASFYSWDVSMLVHSLTPESRTPLRTTILGLWDTFEKIDLGGTEWQGDLISWYRSAKLDLYDAKL